ncbi:MAG: DUF3179 domain-containing protein [Anaerolineales bacterium]|nr:DUF3179 domain-containing protein [Anaerolineales bacterium]
MPYFGKRRWFLVTVLLLLFTSACIGLTETVSEPDIVVETAVPTDPTAPPNPDPTPTDAPEPTATTETSTTETETAANESETAVSASEEPIITEEGMTVFTTDDRSDRLRTLTNNWQTNWSLHTIDYAEVLSGGPPRDGIPSIDSPNFIAIAEAEAWLADVEPVIALDINGDARAYPIQVLTWHEIVNDTVGGTPVIVTFCPLCNSAIAFERIVDGEPVEFGVSGLLRNSDLIMYDRTDESLWQQFTGEGIVGNHAGKRLTILPSSLVSFADFKAAFPAGTVLSRDTGFDRLYGENPYVGYDTYDSSLSRDGNLVLFLGELDTRLAPADRVVTVAINGVDVAYPLSILFEMGVIHDTQGGQDLVVFHTGGTASALGARIIANAEDVGATGVFDPNLDGQKLTFTAVDDGFVDAETGSSWNILGQAIDGPLAGQQLIPIVHADHFWFSWAAFKPDTIIYQP